MKAMFVIRSMARGGAQRQLCALAGGLVARGHVVTVAVFYRGESFERELEAAGVRLIDLRKKSRWDIFGFYARLCRAVRQEQADVVHSYLPTATILCTTLRWAGVTVPVVPSVRASNMTAGRQDWLSYMSFLLERACARFARVLIVNSEAGKQRLRLTRKNQIVAVVDNGIDTEYFRPNAAARATMRHKLGIASNVPIVGLVARLDPMKDHPTFLRAAALVSKHRPDVRFLCVGTIDPPYLAQLRLLASELGLERSLTWIGDEPDMLGLYNALDVLCLSSAYGEGFPNVLAEAMACGTACVATDVGDSARVVFETDRVVPAHDPASLARTTLQALLEEGHPGEQRVRAIRERFSVERLVGHTEQILAAAIAVAGQKSRRRASSDEAASGPFS